jgi:hypothetical protein
VFIEYLVNSWGHQKKKELMLVFQELTVSDLLAQGDKDTNQDLQCILKCPTIGKDKGFPT